MKRVVSVSLGSSSRDHKAYMEIKGETFEIQRIGTDGDMKKAIAIIRELDGKVDAFGMGGIDLYLNAGNRKYIIKDAKPIMNAASISPIVDGTFVKNTLERKVIRYIRDKNIINFKNKTVLMTCALDRFGMAEALIDEGADVTIGDAIFSIGWDLPIHSMKFLHFIAGIIAPVACRMPFDKLYPTGKSQEEKDLRFVKYFYENEIIAGDFLYIKKYMPGNMEGKIIITNTVTMADIKNLKESGAVMLITTTPEIEGRSFGTNVIEAVLTVVSGKNPSAMTEVSFSKLIDDIGFMPRIEILNEKEQSRISSNL